MLSGFIRYKREEPIHDGWETVSGWTREES